MTTYTFTRIDESERDFESSLEMVINGNDLSWMDLLERFREFLSGCGFILPPGEIGFDESFNDVLDEEE